MLGDQLQRGAIVYRVCRVAAALCRVAAALLEPVPSLLLEPRFDFHRRHPILPLLYRFPEPLVNLVGVYMGIFTCRSQLCTCSSASVCVHMQNCY